MKKNTELNYSNLSNSKADRIFNAAEKLGLQVDVCGDIDGAIVEVTGNSDKLAELAKQFPVS